MSRPNPDDLSPREARNLFLDKRRTDSTDWTIQTYHYRLKTFVKWAEENEIERISDMSGWDIDRYEADRRAQGVAPTTIKGSLNALKKLLEYCGRIEAVDEELYKKVDVPTLSRDEQSNDVMLTADDGKQLLSYYRNSRARYATPEHVVLEILWHTGCRLGGLRALDLEDYDPNERVIDFRHRPDTDTPLKNKSQGERPVIVNQTVCDVIDTWITRDRFDKRDEYGREPLLSCRQGRPAAGSIRCYSYIGTQPCLYQECPHGKRRSRCDYTDRTHSSKCPSSRSPHQIRTGSITWQLDRGLSIEMVAERVNSAPDTIRRHYDKASEREKMLNRRREFVDELDIDDESAGGESNE